MLRFYLILMLIIFIFSNFVLAILPEPKFLIMKKFQIQLFVFMTSESQTPVFERIVYVDGNFDYQKVVDSMFLLFGSSCCVEFKILQ